MTVKLPEYKRKRNPYLPVIGLILAVMLAIIAWFAAPYLVDLLIENVDNLQQRVQTAEDGERNLRIAVAVLTWIATLAISMMIVSISTSTRTVLEQEAKTMRPREWTDKEIKRYEKELAKNRAAKKKLLKKLKKKKEREQRGGGLF